MLKTKTKIPCTKEKRILQIVNNSFIACIRTEIQPHKLSILKYPSTTVRLSNRKWSGRNRFSVYTTCLPTYVIASIYTASSDEYVGQKVRIDHSFYLSRIAHSHPPTDQPAAQTTSTWTHTHTHTQPTYKEGIRIYVCTNPFLVRCNIYCSSQSALHNLYLIASEIDSPVDNGRRGLRRGGRVADAFFDVSSVHGFSSEGARTEMLTLHSRNTLEIKANVELERRKGRRESRSGWFSIYRTIHRRK